MSRALDTISIDRAKDELIDFIADPPADTSSGDGLEPPTLGWFNGGRATVAIPLYNARKDIERVLDEVATFARAVPSWDFLFIDDGSTDETLAAFQRRVAAINFVDPGTASRLAIIPSAPHAGLGHATRIAGLESDSEQLIVLLPAFQGDWSLLTRLRDELQSARFVLAEAASAAPWPLRLTRRIVARVLGAAPIAGTLPQAIAMQGPDARFLAEHTGIRSHGFDIELAAIAARLGWNRGAVQAPAPLKPGDSIAPIASTLDSHWLGHLGATCVAGLGIAGRLVLGVYRLGEVATQPTPRTKPQPGMFRRKAS